MEPSKTTRIKNNNILSKSTTKSATAYVVKKYSDIYKRKLQVVLLPYYSTPAFIYDKGQKITFQELYQYLIFNTDKTSIKTMAKHHHGN